MSATWTRRRVTLRLSDGTDPSAGGRPYAERGTAYRVPALGSDAAPGLCVHRATGSSIGGMHGVRYTVTHVVSGWSIYGTTPTLDGALALALRLARCGDWTRTGEGIFADAVMRRSVRRVTRAADRRGELARVMTPMGNARELDRL